MEKLDMNHILDRDDIVMNIKNILHDFENNKIDKYVYLDRSAIMNCKFNYKFKILFY